MGARIVTVSILTRPRDRVRLLVVPVQIADLAVSILTRPRDRVRPGPGGVKCSYIHTSFNPHPTTRPGATSSALASLGR